MTEVIWISVVFCFGFAVRSIGLPPLIGYLAGGFAITYYADILNLPLESTSNLQNIAHIGVLLLLFTVGLKLNVKKVVKIEVIGTGLLHFAFSVAVYAPIIYFVMGMELYISLMLSIALSFSSTVLAAKTLESKNELKSFHGRIAISILIIQDLIAMAVMSVASGTTPSVYALAVFAIPFFRPLFYKILDLSGHDELALIFSLFLALVVGGYGFHAVGLSGELGALVIGAMLAGHNRASEISSKLWGLKELFLVGFFLTIGMNGLPGIEDWKFAILVVFLLPLQAMVFFALLVTFKLKARSAFLTSISLTNFSEFGLIVAVAVMPDQVIPLALAVALSFLFSAPLNSFSHQIFDKIEVYATKLERNVGHPDEQAISLGDSTVLVMGMGRIGKSAYYRLSEEHKVIGLDSDQEKVKRRKEQGINAEYADAEHGGFWATLDLSNIRYCVLAMNCSEASCRATLKLREHGFNGMIVAHAEHQDQAKEIEAAGADETYLTMTEAGAGLASHILHNKNNKITK